MPIRQPIAGELGLKPGEVVQALVASSGDKMALQLGQHQLPLSAQMKLPEGQVAMRVIQTKEGLALVPQLSQQPQASQTLSTTGLSADLAGILTRNMARPQIQSLFAPQGLEGFLTAAGLTDEAKRLNANRLPSNQLTGDLIKSAIQFGALGNEKALLEGVALQGGVLKPWLRQILRLLPQQSELTSRISGLVTELESLQIEALPQSHVRESGLAALLLLRDQPPVELLFERKNVIERDKINRLWILNLHTSLDSLGEVWMKSAFSGKDVELTFWAKESKLQPCKEIEMDLEEALMEHDLHVKSMQIFASPRPGFEKLSSRNTALGCQSMKRFEKEAIALEYGQQEAPTVLAKGSRELALEIIEEAKKHDIFIAEDPQLVAALSKVGLSDQVPEELYHAVAVMLSWAYWMNGLKPDG